MEVEFRGLKQTLDNHKLRCRTSVRLLAELNWSIRGMAVAELFALREQLRDQEVDRPRPSTYKTQELSLANTMRALRDCMRKVDKSPESGQELEVRLSNARGQKYKQRADKRARYRPANPDKKPLGEPTIRKLTPQETAKLREFNQKLAA